MFGSSNKKRSKYQDSIDEATEFGEKVAELIAESYEMDSAKDGLQHAQHGMPLAIEEVGGQKQWSDVQVIIDMVDASKEIVDAFSSENDSAKLNAAKLSRTAIVAMLIKLLREREDNE